MFETWPNLGVLALCGFKPRLYRRTSRWFCAARGYFGVGPTPAAAFEDWDSKRRMNRYNLQFMG